jgi:hypothetical protein
MTNEDPPEIKIYVLKGSLSDLSLLDFSKFNTTILRIDDKRFKDFLTKYPSPNGGNDNWENFEEILESEFGTEILHVLLPKNINAQFSELDLLLCYEILLLLMPSDLSITAIVDFQIINKNSLYYCGETGYDFTSTGDENYFDNYAFLDDHYLIEMNEFINLFKVRFKRISYLTNAVNSYLSSFRTMSYAQAFLELCICLESIIEGNYELSYRIRHHISILCSENQVNAEIVYNNLNKIYNLRSKIIHGETVKSEKIEEYLPYLRCLVSRMIIELILLNIPDRKKLDTILTFSGFVKKPDLSPDYKNMTLNMTSYVRTFYKELK